MLHIWKWRQAHASLFSKSRICNIRVYNTELWYVFSIDGESPFRPIILSIKHSGAFAIPPATDGLLAIAWFATPRQPACLCRSQLVIIFSHRTQNNFSRPVAPRACYPCTNIASSLPSRTDCVLCWTSLI